MTAKQVIRNMGPEERGGVWIGDDGIVHIEITRVVTGEYVDKLIKKVKLVLEEFSGKGKILVNMGNMADTLGIRSSHFRKKSVEQARDLIKNPGFEKAAIFKGNVMQRTIASFIIVASRQKNIKIFLKKEEALDWLKEP